MDLKSITITITPRPCQQLDNCWINSKLWKNISPAEDNVLKKIGSRHLVPERLGHGVQFAENRKECADLVSQITRDPIKERERSDLVKGEKGELRVLRLRCHQGSLRRPDHPCVTIFQFLRISFLWPCLFYLCHSLPDRVSRIATKKFELPPEECPTHSLEFKLTSRQLAREQLMEVIDMQPPAKYLTKWDVSVKSRDQLTFPKPFARPLVNLFGGQQIIDGRNKIAIPTPPPLISPMTCRLKGWMLFCQFAPNRCNPYNAAAQWKGDPGVD